MGILGVDLLDQMGVTIDLKRQLLESIRPIRKLFYAEMETSMHSCVTAFNQGKAAEFENVWTRTPSCTPRMVSSWAERKSSNIYASDISSTPRTSPTKSRCTRYRPSAALSGIPTIIRSIHRRNISPGMDSLCAAKTGGRWRMLNLPQFSALGEQQTLRRLSGVKAWHEYKEHDQKGCSRGLRMPLQNAR